MYHPETQNIAIINRNQNLNDRPILYNILKFNTLQTASKKQEKSDLILKIFFEKFAQEMRQVQLNGSAILLRPDLSSQNIH